MKTPLIVFLTAIAMSFFSCRKEKALSAENNLLSFALNGQLTAAELNPATRTVNISIPYTINKAALSATFSTSPYTVAAMNGLLQTGAAFTGNFTNPATLSITAENGDISTWTITVKTDLELYGLGSNVTAAKSISKSFNWYYDQGASGQYSSVNCGPAAVTMAIKWSDSTFSKSVEDARKTYRSTGGWWYTTDMVNYLGANGISSAYTTLPDNYQTIKKYIDKNYLVLLCLDNYYIRYNADATVHVDKFYNVSAAASGHFIVVKGYRQVDGKFYFEVYDPWSIGATYPLSTKLKGQDRYYLSDDLEQATNRWWDFAIIVPPKGKVVNNSEGMKVLSTESLAVPAQHGGTF